MKGKAVSSFLAVVIFAVIILLSLVFRITPVQANPSLNITVKADKAQYSQQEVVQVYGNLTLDGVLVTDGLVGLQIQTSQDTILTMRTLSTGSPPPLTPYVFIEYVAPTDSGGNPKYSFERGELAYFKVSIVNFDPEPRDVTVAFPLYYSDNTPFNTGILQTRLGSQSTSILIKTIPIPEDAILGMATVYADAYTTWPKLGGTPYCSEVNNAFEITNDTFGGGGQIVQKTITTMQSNGTENYNATLKLPTEAPPGNYTAHVTSRYWGESAYNSTIFRVGNPIPLILGDLGSGPPPTFYEFDGKVDGNDVALFIKCYKGLGP